MDARQKIDELRSFFHKQLHGMISKLFHVGKVILALLDACPLARDLVMQIGEWARVSMIGFYSAVWALLDRKANRH